MAKISILGSGTVGTIVGKGLIQLRHNVVFYDINKKKIKSLINSGFEATSTIKKAIATSEISFICVPTPVTKRGMNLTHVNSITKKLAQCLKEKNEYHLVVIKSTVLPTTTEKVLAPLLEKNSEKSVGKQIGLCVNPEFLTEISKSWNNDGKFSRNFFNEDRIVIGQYSKKCGDKLEKIYCPLGIPIIRTDLTTAEMIKLACNCSLASRISYWNEIFYICQKLGLDSSFIANVAAMDERIGKYGTVHGKAFGGKCLPKDLKALIKFSESLKYNPQFLKAVQNVNEKIRSEHGVRE